LRFAELKHSQETILFCNFIYYFILFHYWLLIMNIRVHYFSLILTVYVAHLSANYLHLSHYDSSFTKML